MSSSVESAADLFGAADNSADPFSSVIGTDNNNDPIADLFGDTGTAEVTPSSDPFSNGASQHEAQGSYDPYGSSATQHDAYNYHTESAPQNYDQYQPAQGHYDQGNQWQDYSQQANASYGGGYRAYIFRYVYIKPSY